LSEINLFGVIKWW